MSSGAKGAAARTRVSIPSSVKKTIEDINEITAQNHSEDEIYAMLKECSMDPNETAQKLLLLDTFHEVKKKRDRRKENLNKEPAESRWKPGSQLQPNKVGRGNNSSRPMSHDAGGRTSAAKEIAISHIPEKVSKVPLANEQETKKSEASSVASPTTAVSSWPSGITSQSTNSTRDNNVLASGSVNNGIGNTSMNFPLHSTLGTIRREVGSHHTPAEVNADYPTERKSTSALQQKMPNDFRGVEKTPCIETAQTTSSSTSVSSVSRPSSNYNNRSQVVGPQKAGPGKEWKPKATNPCVGQGASTTASSEVSMVSVGIQPESQQAPPKEATPELQRKLEELHISDTQHVIIPNHLQVTEPKKLGFCFGSFDSGFGLEMTHDGGLGSDKSPPLSESSESIGEPVKELQLSNQTVSVAAENTEIKYPDHTELPSEGAEDLSTSEVEVLSSIIHDCGESKHEGASRGHEHPVVNTSSSYSDGYVPQTLSGQFTPFESSESQAHDVPRFPGFVQSFDPTSYYAQFYRYGMDGDGSISPHISAGAANKYNGNAALVCSQTSQTPQEGSAHLVMSAASPVPLVTQSAGIMQSSIAAHQQHLPLQPTGIHLTPYPPFIPYGPYFSPFYVPSPAIHQFLSNGAFPQQAQGGSLYPNPPATAAKNSVSQYKQGSNTGSSTHVGVPGSYGPYGLPVANYAAGPVTAAFSSTSNEEVKENNISIGGQQGQPAFTPTQSGQGTLSGIFHPAQAGTAATGHPLLQQSQAITIPIDMVGPAAGLYHQHQQHAQHNWPSNC